MKPRYLRASILIFAIFWLASCGQQNSSKSTDSDTSYNPSEGGSLTSARFEKISVSVNGTVLKSENAFFSEDSEGFNLTAVFATGEILSVRTEQKKEGRFEFPSDKNSASFSSETGSFKIKNGTLEIKSAADNKINGTFEFTLSDAVDSTKTISLRQGEMLDVPKESSALTEQITIPRMKSMEVDTQTGKIVTETTPIEILFKDNILNFKYKEKSNLSFTVKISKFENSSSGTVFYADDSKISSVNIDAFSGNQTTVWYKNGNTLTFF